MAEMISAYNLLLRERDDLRAALAAPADYALVPLDPSESLRGQLCGYGADLSHMDPRDRAVILQRGAERWAEILRWAGATLGVTVPAGETKRGQTPMCGE